MQNNPIPVVFCIDVEPDEFSLNPHEPLRWRGFEAGYRQINEWRQQIEQTTGHPAHFCWFVRLDPQIAEVYEDPAWPLRNYEALFQDLLQRGDSLGIHTHYYRWLDSEKRWLIDHGDPNWVNYCIDVSIEAYVGFWKESSTLFRGGDRWMSHSALQRLENKGIGYDLTVEPGHPEQPTYHPELPHTGSLPDYRPVPKHPYRPSADDFRRIDDTRHDGIWIVPLTTGRCQATSNLRRGSLKKFLGLKRVESSNFTLNLMYPSRITSQIITQCIDSNINSPIVMATRADIFISNRQLRNLQRTLRWLLRQPYCGQLKWEAPADALRCLGYR